MRTLFIKFETIFLSITILSNSICLGQSETGSIAGTISDLDGAMLTNVNIIVMGTPLGAASDANGNFQIDNVSPGKTSLKITCIGYRDKIMHKIDVQSGQTIQLNIQLEEHVLPMQDIIVTPGNFSIAHRQSAKQQAIEKETIAAIPATLDDIYRVIQTMPGVSFSDDYSAHFHVRGGKQSENLILLDGMEIYDPYHMKNIGGAVGIMNMDIIENISIMTGGFEAKYGDRLSSVVSIENRNGSVERIRGNVTAGGTGLSMFVEGPIPFGSCLLSFRKSFLKEAVELLNPTDYTFSPSYYDAQGKISIEASKNNQIILNMLYSKDNSYLERWRQNSDLYSDYGNLYQGIVWKSTPSSKLFSEIVVSRGENFYDNRIGDSQKEKLNLTENAFNWNMDFQATKNHEIGYGLSYKNIRYRYELEVNDLSQNQQNLDDVAASYLGSQKIAPKTYKLAFYIQDKFQILKSLYTNIGVRHDYFEYNNNQQTSPRIGISYHTKHKTIIRAAWGYYCQAPTYTRLAHTKGTEHNPKAEKSIHYVLGIEHYVTDNINFRLEAYAKSLNQMIGHYFDLDEEGHPDIKYGNPNYGRCQGIEFFINGRISDKLSIWAAYAYSKAELNASFVNWQEQKIERRTFPRFTDQPHNFSLFSSYKLLKAWELNLKWRYLSGVPYTPSYPVFISDEPRWSSGDLYSARYPAYHRMDFRIGKVFVFKTYQLAAFLEIKNLYNHKNIFMYDYTIKNNKHVRKAYYSVPFLPTIEFKISF